MAWAILDTSVYIDHWEGRLQGQALESLRKAFVIRHSAVVLSELRRGARTREARRLVESLFRLTRGPWEPSAEDWWTAGRLIQRIGDTQGWNTAKRRDFQNDALIALTARHHGATVVTSDHSDFVLLSRDLGIRVLPV